MFPVTLSRCINFLKKIWCSIDIWQLWNVHATPFFLKKSIDFQVENRNKFWTSTWVVPLTVEPANWVCTKLFFTWEYILPWYPHVCRVTHQYVFENGLFQLSGGISWLFTTAIWQAIERVHVVYDSSFSWRHESSLRFGIGGPRFFQGSLPPWPQRIVWTWA